MAPFRALLSNAGGNCQKRAHQIKELDRIINRQMKFDITFHSEAEIVGAFKEYDARIVFGAETTCWPDRNLAEEYPNPANGGNFR